MLSWCSITFRPARQNLAAVRHNSRLEIRNGSITDQVALSEAVHGVDTIFHLAAAVGVKLVADDPVAPIETNIYPTDHLLRLAVQGKVKKFFMASTSEVYGKHPGESWVEDDDLHLGPTSRPRWAYGCSKAIDEFLALAYHRKYGLGVTVGRFFNVVGPHRSATTVWSCRVLSMRRQAWSRDRLRRWISGSLFCACVGNYSMHFKALADRGRRRKGF